MTIEENKVNKETIEEKQEKTKEKETKKVEIKFKTKKGLITAIFVIFISVLFCTFFALININNKKIIKGVKINNIDISNITKEEAKNKILNITNNQVVKTIKLYNKEWNYEFEINQINPKYDIEKAINEAYNLGKSGNIFKDNFDIMKTIIYGNNILMKLQYNEEELNNILIDMQTTLPEAIERPTYTIEDNKLIIHKGHSGHTINQDQVKRLILDSIEDESNNSIYIDIMYKDVEEININKIYEEIYTEPKDAYYTSNPFEIFPHVNGIKFDLDEAKKIISEDKEEYEIELIITEPEVLTEEIGTEAFPNLLSSCTTKYDESNKNRSNNLKIAGEKLNGKVIMPGEIFSYNATLGKRTIEAGYKAAAGYSGGKVVQTIGGGICQISSTLYDAVVYANLGIEERHNHMFLTGYIDAGKDATVSYGGVDFKFKNTRKYPIMIKTNVKNGIAKIDIYGVKEENEYEIEISSKILHYISPKTIYEVNSNLEPGTEKTTQYGKSGCKSIAYKIYKLNGIEVSREILSEDTYSAMNKIVEKGPEIIAVPEEQPVIEESLPVTDEVINIEEEQQLDLESGEEAA